MRPRVVLPLIVVVVAVVGVTLILNSRRDPADVRIAAERTAVTRDPRPDLETLASRVRTAPNLMPERAAAGPTALPPSLEAEPETDPTSPRYDANKLVIAGVGRPSDLFDVEPRDKAWASEREAMIKTIALTRLHEMDPGAQLDIECRTAICLVHLGSNNKAIIQWMGWYPIGCMASSYGVVNQARGGDAEAPGSLPFTSPDFYLVFGPARRSPGGLLERDGCNTVHDAWMAGVADGKAPWDTAAQE